MDDISDGVKILCDRMESNPEEFLDPPYDPNTFDRKLGRFYYDGKNIESLAKGEPENVYWYLSDAEKQALIVSYVRMIRAEHTRTVVERLLEKPEPEADVAKAVRKVNRPLNTAQMVNESLQLMNKSFDEAYAKDDVMDSLVYKATGRYEIPNPWDKK
jgi:hypothetical protein